jgi:hypothetical protein
MSAATGATIFLSVAAASALALLALLTYPWGHRQPTGKHRAAPAQGEPPADELVISHHNAETLLLPPVPPTPPTPDRDPVEREIDSWLGLATDTADSETLEELKVFYRYRNWTPRHGTSIPGASGTRGTPHTA